MSTTIQSPSSPTSLMEVDTTKAGRVVLYDALGNPLARTAGAQVSLANYTMEPIGGFDQSSAARGLRTDPFGVVRTTSDTILALDVMDSASALNPLWASSLSAMTLGYSAGKVQLNSAAATTANGYAILTSNRQFPKYPRHTIQGTWRLRVGGGFTVHSTAEFGFGAPSGNTPSIANGAFFRVNPFGQWFGVLSYGGTEYETPIPTPALNSMSWGIRTVAVWWATNIVDYIIEIDDDSVRFSVSDDGGTVLSDACIQLGLAGVPRHWAVSHLPAFIRIYADSIGGGGGQQIDLTAFEVLARDLYTNKPWAHQLSSCYRQAAMNPASGVQTLVGSSIAPVGGAVAAFGGEYILTVTAASETPVLLFDGAAGSGYSFHLTGLTFSVPVVSTNWSISSTVPIYEPVIVMNSTAATFTTSNGLWVPMPGQFIGTSITAAAGTLMSGTPIIWTPQVPLVLNSGNYLLIGFKVLNGGAVSTGAIRGVVEIDGYWE